MGPRSRILSPQALPRHQLASRHGPLARSGARQALRRGPWPEARQTGEWLVEGGRGEVGADEGRASTIAAGSPVPSQPPAHPPTRPLPRGIITAAATATSPFKELPAHKQAKIASHRGALCGERKKQPPRLNIGPYLIAGSQDATRNPPIRVGIADPSPPTIQTTVRSPKPDMWPRPV